MDKKIVKFDDTETEVYEFHQYKSSLSINNIDINRIVVSKQHLTYFVGYKDSEKIRPLCIFRPQMIIYKRNFDEIEVFLF